MSILVVTERIYCYQFKCNYLKKWKIFAALFLHFPNLSYISNVLKTKINFIGHVFLKLLTPKDVLTYVHNRAGFWKSLGSERVNDRWPGLVHDLVHGLVNSKIS